MGIPSILQHSLFVLQVRAIIEYALQKKEFVHYKPLAQALKVFSGGKELALALGAIVEEDHRAGRPLTCALVVSGVTGMPGDGFFVKARALGYQFADNETFWRKQCTDLGMVIP